MNESHPQITGTAHYVAPTEPHSTVQDRIWSLLVDYFDKTGCVPAVDWVAKELGIAWTTINRRYQELIEELPGKEAVESAYLAFLYEACRSQKKKPTKTLLESAARARITARHVAKAVQLTESEITKRASKLNIELSEFKAPGLAVPRRLTDRALDVLQESKVCTSIAARVADVSHQTLKLKMERLAEARKSAIRERSQGTKSQKIVEVIEELGQGGEIEDVLIATSRKLLCADGKNPDELIAGAYRSSDCPDGTLRCDKIEIVDGQAMGFIYTYRREAARLRRIWDMIRETACEESLETQKRRFNRVRESL